QAFVGAPEPERAAFFWPRPQLQRHLGNDPQRTERADVELAQIVAGDILDDATTRFDLLPFVVDGADADDVIPQRAIALAARTTGVGGQGAAEGGLFRTWHIDRQLLVFLVEYLLQFRDGDASLNGDRHVPRRIVDDLIQPSQIDADAGPSWR